MPADIVFLTAAARHRMITLLEQNGLTTLFFGVSGKGCGGLSYDIEWGTVEDRCANPTILLSPVGSGPEYVLVVGSESVPFILGTTIDWQETTMSSNFVFNNPMAGGSCGCGQSFSVSQ